MFSVFRRKEPTQLVVPAIFHIRKADKQEVNARMEEELKCPLCKQLHTQNRMLKLANVVKAMLNSHFFR